MCECCIFNWVEEERIGGLVSEDGFEDIGSNFIAAANTTKMATATPPYKVQEGRHSRDKPDTVSGFP